MADKTYIIGKEGALDLRVGLDDLNGDERTFALKVSVEAISGADSVNGVMKTEERFVHSGLKTADALIKTGPGFLHALQFSMNDAAPTAGTIDVYDNTTNSGTKLFSWTFTTAVFSPFSVILNVPFATGLYFDITTAADVNVSGSYR